MRLLRVAMAVAALFATPAWAAGEASPFSGSIDNYATYDDTGLFETNHELTLTLEGKAGEWTLGAKAWFGVVGDFPPAAFTIETPTLLLYARSDAFGEIGVWDATTALGNACVTPPGGSTHFGTEELLTFGTCAGYGGQAITYITPSFFDGFGLQVSVMKDVIGATAAGEVDSAVSAALTYSTTTATDVTYSASLGIDVATSVNGGVPAGTSLPVTLQGGASVAWDGWTVGGAAQYEHASLSGGNSLGLGAGISRAVTEQLTLGAEVAFDAYQDAGVAFQELSLGSTAEFKLLDNVSVDSAINIVHRTGDDGTDVMAWVVGTGFAVGF